MKTKILLLFLALLLPVIGQAADTKTVPLGHTVTLSVAFTSDGSPVTYQWLKNGGAIPGATAATYVIPAFAAGHAGSYSVVVTNANGSTRSDDGVLLAPLPPSKGVVTATVTAPSPVLIP